MRGIMLMLVVLALIAGCGPKEAPGTLSGKVTIGPLCPVEPCNVPADRVAAAYAARSVVVYDRANNPVQEIRISPTGEYSADIAPGQYVVDVKKLGVDNAVGVPKTVIIESGKTKKVDIDIDTGIR